MELKLGLFLPLRQVSNKKLSENCASKFFRTLLMTKLFITDLLILSWGHQLACSVKNFNQLFQFRIGVKKVWSCVLFGQVVKALFFEWNQHLRTHLAICNMTQERKNHGALCKIFSFPKNNYVKYWTIYLRFCSDSTFVCHTLVFVVVFLATSFCLVPSLDRISENSSETIYHPN